MTELITFRLKDPKVYMLITPIVFCTTSLLAIGNIKSKNLRTLIK
jgi:hypothetical protein